MAITSSSFFEDETSMSPFTLGQQFFTISLNVSVVNSPLRNQIIASTLLDRAIGEWSLSTGAPRKDVRSFTTVAYLFSNLRGSSQMSSKTERKFKCDHQQCIRWLSKYITSPLRSTQNITLQKTRTIQNQSHEEFARQRKQSRRRVHSSKRIWY